MANGRDTVELADSFHVVAGCYQVSLLHPAAYRFRWALSPPVPFPQQSPRVCPLPLAPGRVRRLHHRGLQVLGRPEDSIKCLETCLEM
jgi:hypothetical protein